jgi:hypothetical protein
MYGIDAHLATGQTFPGSDGLVSFYEEDMFAFFFHLLIFFADNKYIVLCRYDSPMTGWTSST